MGGRDPIYLQSEGHSLISSTVQGNERAQKPMMTRRGGIDVFLILRGGSGREKKHKEIRPYSRLKGRSLAVDH